MSEKSFKDTLNLPKTDFPIRANSKVDDPQLLERWQKEDLYEKTYKLHESADKYILHDGPPYANGHIHLGHAYNKILKDIVTKFKRMSGYHVPVKPGWDCHGLPIEFKVTQEKKFNSRLELIKASREYASHWIDVQRQEFKKLGVLMNWDHPYITMSPDYEGSTVRAFGILVDGGYIERKNKTVPWCYSCQTVLAAAEIEYEDRKDPSLYVLFTLKDWQKYFPEIKNPIDLVVWTTTPWTLPLNRAVMLHKDASYSLIQINDKYIIVGSQVAPKFCKMLNTECKIIREFKSSELKGAKVEHPFVDNLVVPILFEEGVGLEEGTAAVHTAPGCGPIDYEIGVKNNLEIFSPITTDGKYSLGIEPKELEGMSVQDGQIWVIKKLAEKQKLFHKASITHSYPHCWRCHNGLIFRATKQWFFDLNRQNIKQEALDAIEKIKFIPEQGKNFLKATVSNRWEWCLSRQRAWGVPIPALLCNTCDYTFTSKEFIDRIAKGIEKEGIEYWAHVPLKDIAGDTTCPKCGTSDFRKETDILDVWFDAGVSHFAVLYKNDELAFPADLYLEGVDQHRGWFQSSLLNSLVIEGEACTKAIMTHGYTVDEKGRKMSKSLGNVVLPQDIIEKIGTDGLRLWVASIGYDSDPVVSEKLTQNVSEVYRKIRNTCRFLLSNLYDFDLDKDAVRIEQLQILDRYALVKLYNLQNEMLVYYNACDFTAVFHGLAEYCSSELSAFYLDMIKDRLYVEKADGTLRRSAQTVMWHILDVLTKLTAPIMSFTAELVTDHFQKNKKDSIHLQKFSSLKFAKEVFDYDSNQSVSLDVPYHQIDHIQETRTKILYEDAIQYREEQWEVLKSLRSIILKAIEELRAQGIVGHSLDSQVTLFVDSKVNEYDKFYAFLNKLKSSKQDLTHFFKEFFVVSQFKLVMNDEDLPKIADGIYAQVAKAIGEKCPRCWQWDEVPGKDNLCRRCQKVLGI